MAYQRADNCILFFPIYSLLRVSVELSNTLQLCLVRFANCSIYSQCLSNSRNVLVIIARVVLVSKGKKEMRQTIKNINTAFLDDSTQNRFMFGEFFFSDRSHNHFQNKKQFTVNILILLLITTFLTLFTNLTKKKFACQSCTN